MRRQKYTDIKGEGIFINRQFTKFCLRAINDDVGLYIPEEFIDMPEEIQLMKFPSVNRPQRIFTSLDGSVNFAFSIVDYQIPDTQIESLAEQMEEVIRKSNPAAIFIKTISQPLLAGVLSVCSTLKITASMSRCITCSALLPLTTEPCTEHLSALTVTPMTGRRQLGRHLKQLQK